jgi:phosphatidylinositol alpha 1,6-mannosyltransferase
MDNAIPIPFLHDAERPELTYQIGFSLSPTVKQMIDEFEPSIVHITVPDCTSLHIIQYARAKEIPIMGTYHSNIPEYMEHYPGLSWLKHILGAFFRHQYNYVQELYVPTPYIQRHLIDEYTMDRVTTLKVWGRGVDVDKFNPAYRSMKYRRHLGIADDTAILLWVGRLVPEKRPDIFANVVRRLHSRGLNFHALVVGAGPCEPEIKSLPNTTFAGWMSADQLSTVYASSDIFLFPSAVETFGNVTLEAAASGLPVVVEAGCSGHLVHDGENGYTAAADDDDAFFEATLALVEDRQMREEFSANSREMALSLEKTTVVRQMLENYCRVTDQFYTEYSGRHANRDALYTKPDSFLLGRNPRPLILVFFEYIFVMLFNLMWNLSRLIAWISKRFKRSHSIDSSEGPVMAVTGVASTRVPSPPSSVPVRHLKEKQAAIDSTSSNYMSVIELDDVEIGNCSKEPLLSADDNTAATGSSSQDTSSSTQSFGDCRLSHTLAKMFVSTVQFQCRMESRVRYFLTSYHSPPRSQFMGAAKRKNSSMAVTLSDMGGQRETVIRGRLEAFNISGEPLPPMDESSSPGAMSSGGLQEGRILRRNQNSVLEVY